MKTTTEKEQDAEVLRVIKAIGFPISAKALHEIFRDRIHNTQVNQSVWRYMGREIDLDIEMKIRYKWPN